MHAAPIDVSRVFGVTAVLAVRMRKRDRCERLQRRRVQSARARVRHASDQIAEHLLVS